MRSKLGFTLLELLVAISIIAIISAVGFSTFSQSQMRGRDARRKQDLRSIAVALELYYQKNKRYPVVGTYSPAQNSSTSGGNWINDVGSTPAVPLDSTYINITPLDPINTGAYLYGYINWSNGWGTCSGSKFFIMFAKLENLNDKELYTSSSTNTICGVSAISWLYGYLVLYSNP